MHLYGFINHFINIYTHASHVIDCQLVLESQVTISPAVAKNLELGWFYFVRQEFLFFNFFKCFHESPDCSSLGQTIPVSCFYSPKCNLLTTALNRHFQNVCLEHGPWFISTSPFGCLGLSGTWFNSLPGGDQLTVLPPLHQSVQNIQPQIRWYNNKINHWPLV